VAIQRLRGRERFAALRSEGRRARNGPILVRFVPAIAPTPAPSEPAREPDRSAASRAPDRHVYVAFAVGRPVGGAVVRNRVRRRLRSIVAGANTAPGDYLVQARPDAATLSYDGLRHCTVSAIESAVAASGPNGAGPR